MKKVLFVINNLEIGGIQKSLIELLNCIRYQYDVTIYCVNFQGAYVDEVPDNVKIIRGSRFAKIAELDRNQLKELGSIYPMIRTLCVVWTRIFGKRIPAYIYAKLLRLFLRGRYDVAISYSQPLHSKQFAGLYNEIVLYAINAENKCTFVHCDYKNYGGNTTYNNWLYSKFDLIAAVSESVKKQFLDILPQLSSKVHVVYNACDTEKIKELAEIDPVKYRYTSIVSVSRLSKEKGLARCIPIIRNLIDEGFVFEWHILGDGPEKKALVSMINKYNLYDYVILEGMQNNPYRYLKNADYLFVPSYHEAAPMVFNEAAVLNTFILTTNTLSAEELVASRGIGMVCENNEDGIKELLQNAVSNKLELKNKTIEVNTLVSDQFSALVAK